jgi:hypothetical protein
MLEPDVVGVMSKDGTSFFLRRYAKPPLGEHHKEFGERHKSACRLWGMTSAEFKLDCREYARLYNEQVREFGRGKLRSNNVFLMVMNKYGCVFEDLSEVKREIGSNLSEWIANNHLKRVKTMQQFTGEIL